VVFQLAHCVEEADFPLPDSATNRMENAWAIHQAQTTVDFSKQSRILSWYLGGLNFQIEHHLLPHVCHVHYRALSKIVEATCKEYGGPLLGTSHVPYGPGVSLSMASPNGSAEPGHCVDLIAPNCAL
jgi:linoleoyl-CoA desaturase